MTEELLTREEAASYLKVSVRTLDRLPLPRYYVGRLPRYSMCDLGAYLSGTRTEPQPLARGNVVVMPRSPSRSRQNAGNGDWLKSRLAALKAA